MEVLHRLPSVSILKLSANVYFEKVVIDTVWNMFHPRQIKLTVTKYSFLQVYKLTTFLVSLTKKSLSTIKYPFLYYLKTA